MTLPLLHSPRLLKTLDVPVESLERFPDLAHDICTGIVDVSIIRGVFSVETMSTVLDRMRRGDHGMIVTPQEDPDPNVEQVTVYGDAITPNDIEQAGPPAERYHASAIHFREACRRLFHGLPDYETRVDEVFRRVAGGRKVDVPRDAKGRVYTPSTIRKIPPGHEINLHVGNYFLTTAPYVYLGTLFAPLDQLSFFVPISPPESGGEIEVFELVYQDPRTPFTPDGHVDGNAVAETFRFESFAPGTGDMFLFNGGRYYHRVDFVKGKRPRWTIGGFLSFAKDDRILYHWG